MPVSASWIRTNRGLPSSRAVMHLIKPINQLTFSYISLIYLQKHLNTSPFALHLMAHYKH